VLQHVMNQPSPKEQMASDLELAQSIESALYPEGTGEDAIWNRAGVLPSEMRADYLRQHGINIPDTVEVGKPITPTDLKNITDRLALFKDKPDLFEAERMRLQETYGYNLSNYVPEIFQENENVEVSNLYNTPSSVLANVSAPKGLVVVPKRDSSTGKYYADFQKAAPTTEDGYMSVGEKREIDVAKQQRQEADNILFGTTDVFSGIRQPGLIPNNVSLKLSRGVELTPEEITPVLNSWNTIKDNYPTGVQNLVEANLSRYGIKSENITEPEPEPEPEEKTSGVDYSKIPGTVDWFKKNVLGIGEEIEPVPESDKDKGLEAPKQPALHTPDINKQIEQDRQYTKENPDSLSAIQRTLKEQGYWDYEITGKWTELLENALRQFYREQQQ